MDILTTSAWLLTLIIAAAPPERLAAAPAFPGWAETPSARTERYQGIADAAARVALDPAEAPLPGMNRRQTAAMILTVAFHESGFAPDVDAGPCYPQGARCDGRQSACMMQIKLGAGHTPEGWTQADLFGDREKCFRSGLRLLRRSATSCAKLGPDLRWAAYALGTCGIGGYASSRRFAGIHGRWLARHPPPAATASILPVISPTTEPKGLRILSL